MKKQATLFSVMVLITFLSAFYSCTVHHQTQTPLIASNLLVADTILCPNFLYDSLYHDNENIILVGAPKFDTGLINFKSPLFSSSDVNVVAFNVVKYNSNYYNIINLNCATCKIDTGVSKYYKGSVISFSKKQVVTYEGRFILFHDFEKNITNKVSSPFPWVYKFISSPDGNFLLTANNHLFYRFNISRCKLDSILIPTCTSKPYFLVGDWSKSGKIIFAEAPSYNQDTVFINVLDKNLKQTDKVIAAIGTSQKIIAIDCIKFNPLNDNEFYYSFAGKGIFKMNIKTNQATLIKESCPYKSIDNFTISPDGKIIVAEINVKNYSQNNPLNIYSRLMYIDLKDNVAKFIAPNLYR